ncbi:M48 family metallopeptidase [Parvularcula oceani]|uniref:M48 family metallopeptidase n=1 Tax=Parvularcula oceani TaxID=1247963 RepID=UPI00068D75D7|nr:SprT family zinc-dependent metalloprotease [Parvularcula oceani]
MAALREIDGGTVLAGGQALPVTIRFDRRARRLILRLTEDGVRVTCPGRHHQRAALEMVEARRGWIEARLAERPVPVPFAIGACLPLFGRDRVIRAAASTRSAARLEGDAIMTGGGDAAAVARRVEALVRTEAKRTLQAESDRLAAKLGLPPCPVSVRRMRSRWGSCSSAPALSYDWRLAFAPPEVLAYVAAHEVAHRRHMDHSARFWRLVAELMPGWKPADGWLRANGRTLYAYGTS